jgi:uncharacterized membrane protein
MPSPPPWSLAALGGFASSMRTFAGPALLAARGRISGKPRIAVLIGAVGELAVDKTALATDRIAAPAVGGRVTSAAYTGHAIAGLVGAGAAAASAAVGTYATYHARRLIVEKTGLPDWAVAIGEDLLAMTAAGVATRPA